MAKLSPFGYCPDCGKSGIKEDGGTISCINGHSYQHFEAVWPEKVEKDSEKNKNDPWANSKIAESSPVLEVEASVGPKIVPITNTPKIIKNGEVDLIKLAKNVQESNQRIEKGFEKVYKDLKNLLEEVKQYLPEKDI